MAIPIINIGIGTSGLKATEEAHRFYYYNTGEGERLSISEVKNIFIETDNAQKYEFLGNEIDTIPIRLKMDFPAFTAKKFRDKGIGTNWIPKSLPEMANHETIAGAGGIPFMGRLILWENFKDVYNTIKKTIEDSVKNTREINKKIADEGVTSDDIQYGIDPIIYIVGSLTGGTCSGMFIDIAMMIRHMGYKNVYGLFMLPPRIDGHTDDYKPYGNAYGALKALSRFDDNLKTKNIYDEKWPEGFNSPGGTQHPFKFIQFISQSYKEREFSISKLDGLYKTAGLYLYLNRIGLLSKWSAKFVDAIGDTGPYGTFSLAGAHFPKDDIESYAAIELGVNLINRWIHPSLYFGKSSQKFEQINEVKINEIETKRIKNIVAKSLTTFDANSSQNLLKDLENYLKKIEVEKLGADYLKEIFASNVENNFYKKTKIGISYAEDTLKREIYEANLNTFKDTESISLVKITLEKSASALENIHKFWASHYKIDSELSTWTTLLSHEAANFDFNTTPNRKLEQLKSIFELMKKHFLYESLVKIGSYIKSEKVNRVLKFDENFVLPHIGLYSKIETKLKPLLNENDEVNKNKSLIFLKLKIENNVVDDTMPYEKIYRDKVPLNKNEENIFPFKKAVEDTIRNYEDKKKQYYSFIDLANIVPEINILDYLSSEKQESTVIYNHVMLTYRTLLKDSNSIKNYPVTDDLAKNKGTLRTISDKVKGPILHLNELIRNQDLVNSGTIKKLSFALGMNNLETGKVLRSLSEINNNNPFPDTLEHKFEVSNLQNSMFLFRQFAKFKPLKDLANIELWEEIYRIGDKTEKKEQEKFMEERTAYFKTETPEI